MGALKIFCIVYGVLEILGVAGYLMNNIIGIQQLKSECNSGHSKYSEDICSATDPITTIILVVCGSKLVASFCLLGGIGARKTWAIMIWLIYNGICYGLASLMAVIGLFTAGAVALILLLFVVLAWLGWEAVRRYHVELGEELNGECVTTNQFAQKV